MKENISKKSSLLDILPHLSYHLGLIDLKAQDAEDDH